MKEIRIVELLPTLNSRGVMGRVVVPHSFPKDFRPHVTGKIFMCCNRAFLTEASLQKHRSVGGCSNQKSLLSYCDKDDGSGPPISLDQPAFEYDATSCPLFEQNDHIIESFQEEQELAYPSYLENVSVLEVDNSLNEKYESTSSVCSKATIVMNGNTSEVGSPSEVGLTRSTVSNNSEDSEVMDQDSSQNIYFKPESKNVYKCPQCDYQTKYNWNLTHHKTKAHVEDGNFACQYCSCIYGTQYGLSLHLTLTHGNIRKRCSETDRNTSTLQEDACNKNSLTFETESTRDLGNYAVNTQPSPAYNNNFSSPPSIPAIVSHWIKSVEQKHHGVSSTESVSDKESATDPLKYVCQTCSKSFPMKHHLLVHCRQEHTITMSNYGKDKLNMDNTDGRKPSCHICQKTFRTSQRLFLHERVCHVEGGSFPCTSAGCKCVFDCRRSLSQHLFQTHKLRRTCPSVADEANESSNLESSGDSCDISITPKYDVCNICGFCATDTEEWNSHIKFSHVACGLPCECGCSFATVTELTKHKNEVCLKSSQDSTSVLTNIKSTTMSPRKDLVDCSVCKNSFTAKGLRLHMFLVHNELNYLACEICRYPTKNYRNYKMHKKACHVLNGIMCEDCPCSFRTFQGLSHHAFCMHKKKLDKTQFEIKCRACNFTALLKADLDKHYENHHSQKVSQKEHDNDIYQCEHCEYQAANLTNLRVHEKKNHVTDGFQCQYCNNSFSTELGLRCHVQQLHGKQDFVGDCNLCNYRTNSTKNLSQHIMKCHAKDGFQCSDCSFSLRHIDGLMKHMRMIHKKKVDKSLYSLKCNTCDYNTYYHQDLKRHQRAVHVPSLMKPKSIELIKCTLCDFPITSTAEDHVTRCHVVGGHKCSDCCCSFATEIGQKRHMISRHGIKSDLKKLQIRNSEDYPESCTECNFRAKTKIALNIHSQKKHGFPIPIPKSPIKIKIKKCEICNLRYTGTSKEHHLRNHGKNNAFKCNYCICRFHSKLGQMRHTSRHHKAVEMMTASLKKNQSCSASNLKKCNICSMRVSDLNGHIKKNHVTNGLSCSFCACRFSTTKGRSIHTKLMHAKYSQFALSTQLLKEDTYSKSVSKEPQSMLGLDEDDRGIKKEVKLTCPKCGYLATCPSHLNIHLLKSHVKNSPYPCKVCPCGYSTEMELERHTKLLHPDPVYIVKELTRIFEK